MCVEIYSAYNVHNYILYYIRKYIMALELSYDVEISQGQQNLSIKSQTVNTLGFAGHSLCHN